MEKLEKINLLLGNIRQLSQTNREMVFPVSFRDTVESQPVDPMKFEVGKWSGTPWPGVKCFGVKLSDHEVKVICEIIEPIKLNKQEHGPWTERLVMDTGKLLEHTTGKVYEPGRGEYNVPAGRIHEPEFLAPSICVITWTRDKKD